MPTLAAGASFSQAVSGGNSVRIQTAHNVSGRIRFVPSNTELPPPPNSSRSFGPLPMDRTFGPWGMTGTVVIDCDAGSASTLTYDINPDTIPSGTANGVLYLNGSNQVTSGSALTFDGTNLGVGTASSAALLHINKTSGAADIRLSVGNVLYGTLYSSSSDTTLNSVSSIPLIFGTNNAERMRISSSGRIGIGSTDNNFHRLVVTESVNSGATLLLQSNATSVSPGLTQAAMRTGSARVENGDGLGALVFQGWDGVSVSGQAVISSSVDGATATGNIPTRLVFLTAPSGSVTAVERFRITAAGNQVATQGAESAQNTSVTLTVANLQAGIITSNAAVTLTLPAGSSLESYSPSMSIDTGFDCVFIATTANAITIAANGNTTVGSLTVAGNTSGTFRFRKTATNTFTVYRVA